MSNHKGQQTKVSVEKNADWFLKNNYFYEKNTKELDIYIYIYNILTEKLKEVNTLLDIGNGGVFNYDTSKINKIIGLDLFLESLPKDIQFSENIEMRNGDALDLPELDDSYDGALLCFLVHHLVGENVEQNYWNMQKCLSEAFRCIKPGGKLFVMESTVPNWFYKIEKLIYRSASYFIEKTISHPPTFQFTDDILSYELVKLGGVKLEKIIIPKGKWIMQLGFKFPAKLTPAQPILYILTK